MFPLTETTEGSAPVHEGAVIDGRYRVLGRAGHGAMGTVWRAKDERLDRLVAIKQLFPDSPADPASAERTRDRTVREARVTARLRHPHAVVVYDVVEEGSGAYITMEYLPSRTLTELLEERGPLVPEYVAELGAQLASALAAAHAEGVVHRDISPNNVLITTDGAAKITDFGAAHARGEGTATGRGLVVGTPAYLAPEVADGAEPGFPADVYSLGATLYTALEGRPPFGTDENQLALLKRVGAGAVTPPVTSGPVTDAVLRLLHRDPAARPAMAGAARLLTRATVPGVAPVAAPADRAPAPARRRRSRVAFAGTALALTAAAVVAATSLPPGREPASAAAQLASAPSTTPPSKPLASRTTGPAGCAARYQVVKSWNGGFQGLVTVRNSGRAEVTGWTVSWATPAGTSIDDLWNGRLVRTGATAAIANAEWNAVLKPGESTTFGFIALARGGNRGMPVTDCRPGE
ncbi:serine/threonine protein kinase [Amycolatopsis mediterranei S699]|uniref:non-specific serine/threonine protein kinase n=1 Tax=Amycolatopsis mediterranei (strain U-32) TaxID=749927 RepID=A0A0H3D2W5_AMYMU|nr:serine/threonine-protein kinase [Amycolatopsis mediterranei]ADJ44990.1 putative serine/threonine protein kinase [Amycolatopsis mediterranei U32]AFO76701.1 serine/threonine protein kinase [Amycolatopsis mediterranei S699]AGT83829.1 serine/threonine protein kinase [Amycolatopsis mediterranei RB]UZF70260.1 protein kinase [Amycolatopsis mediterranei]